MSQTHRLDRARDPEDDTPFVPTVTVAQMREVDRIMIQELGIELVQMMENAGRALAEQTRRLLLGGIAAGRRVVVAAGAGANGGGGLAAARRLLVWGAEVVVVLPRSLEETRGTPAQQLAIARRLGIRINSGAEGAAAALAGADAVVDALIGYGLQGPPRPPVSALIDAVNGSGVPVIALDVPSGLDADLGTAPGAAVRAVTTITLALPKVGLLAESARIRVGSLYLADISVPPTVYQRLGLEVGPIFARSDIVELAHR